MGLETEPQLAIETENPVEQLRVYFNAIAQSEKMLPEMLVLEWFDLYDKEKPEESPLIALMDEPEKAQEILDSLSRTGTYPDSFVEGVQGLAIGGIREKRETQERHKSWWRKFKLGTKLVAVGAEIIAGMGISIPGPVVYAVVVWAVIDEVTADSEERIIAELATLVLALPSIASEESEVERVGEAGLPGLLFGDEVDEDVKEVVSETTDYVRELLGAGVPPIAILEELKRRRFNFPIFRTMEDAAKNNWNRIERSLNNLKIIWSKKEEERWDSSELKVDREEMRMDMANMAMGIEV